MPRPGLPRDCIECDHAEGFHTHGVGGGCGYRDCDCKAFVEPKEKTECGITVVAERTLISPPNPPRITLDWIHAGKDEFLSLSVDDAKELVAALQREIANAEKMEAASPSWTGPRHGGRLG